MSVASDLRMMAERIGGRTSMDPSRARSGPATRARLGYKPIKWLTIKFRVAGSGAPSKVLTDGTQTVEEVGR
jgi:hypothetical protein